MRAVTTASLLAIGMAGGGALTWLALDEHAAPALELTAPASTSTALPGATPDADARAPRTADAGGEVAPSDATDLEARITARALAPPSYARDFELETWLVELAETDPARAARFAVERGLPRSLVDLAFKAWAEADPEGAIAGLPTLPRELQRHAALAMTEVLGSDPANVERLAGAMPGMDELSFLVDAIGRRSLRDPLGAVRAALDLKSSREEYLTLQDLGILWGSMDPAAAIAAVELYPELGSGSIFSSRVFEQWPRVDVRGFLDYVARTGNASATSGFATAAAADPEAALAAAENVSGQLGASLKSAALDALARLDPAAAIARVASLQPGRDRDTFVTAVTAGYASVDPNAAYAWAQTLDPPVRNAQRAALAAIGAVNADRAVDLALTAAAGRRASEALALLLPVLQRPEALQARTLTRIADAMTTEPMPASRLEMPGSAWDVLGSAWARADPGSAIDWANAHEAVSEPLLRSIATELGMRDLDAAMLLVSRLPANRRADWIAGSAAAQAQFDPQAAFRALERIRNDDGFAKAAPLVVQTAALRDSAAAGGWVMQLPQGELRDDALAALIPAAASGGYLDDSWLGAFNSAAARQNALLQALPSLAAAAPADAEALLNTWFTDPAARSRAEEAMRRPLPLRGAVMIGNTIIRVP